VDILENVNAAVKTCVGPGGGGAVKIVADAGFTVIETGVSAGATVDP
jgi:hypothetical protein